MSAYTDAILDLEEQLREAREAIIDLWESQAGGECEHGRGLDHCEGCAEEGSGLNDIRPTIAAAYEAVKA